MPAATQTVTCPVGQWTLVADGKTNVMLKSPTVGELRIHVGQSAPAANSEAYVTTNEWSSSVLTSTDKVYVMPYSEHYAMSVEVMTA